MAIEAVFQFFAKNPPSILIAGGILLYLVGSVQKGLGGGSDLLGVAPWLIGAGFVLQVLWLMFHK